MRIGNTDRERSLKRMARYKAATSWHSHFAILPAPVSSTEFRWLEFVERRATRWTASGPKGWIYRAIDE